MSKVISDANLKKVSSTAGRLKSLPVVDYDEHPAYGKAFPKPSILQRTKAVFKLLPWMGVVLFKRVTMMDRIPALPGYTGHIQGGFAGRFKVLGNYIPHILKAYKEDFVALLKGGAKFQPAAEHEKVSKEFVDTGFLVANLEDKEHKHLLDLVEKPIQELRHARATAKEITFIGNTRFFNPGDHKELFDAMNAYMQKHGMLDAAGAFIGRKVQVTHLLIQINDPSDAYFHNLFPDVGLPDPETNYMHVDTSYDMVKAVVYLNEVGLDNGAFSYVLGSQHVRPLGFEGVLRRAVDRAGLSSNKKERRQMFYSLPKFLRKKCTFGLDLLDGTQDSKDMLERELYLTSEQGNMGLFANNGVHRGGLTKTGERIVFFATIA